MPISRGNQGTFYMVGRIDGIASSWQPNISEFGQQVAASLSDVREKIDAYDKSIGDYWSDSTLPWVARRVAGEIGHSYYSLPVNNALSSKIPEGFLKAAENKLAYDEMFGIDNYKIIKPNDISWKELLRNKEYRDMYKMAVSGNFENFLKTEHLKTLTPTSYFKRTVIGNNVHNLTEDLQTGRALPFLARLLGFGVLGHEIISNTLEYYRSEKSKEDDSELSHLKTLGKIALCFLGETIKGIATWEIGNLGYKIGAGILCIGTIPAIVAGCVLGGLFSAGIHSLFDSDKNT